MNLFLITSVYLVSFAFNQFGRVESKQNATKKSSSDLVSQVDWAKLAASLIGAIIDEYAQELNHSSAGNQRPISNNKSSRSHYHSHRYPAYLHEHAESYLDSLFRRRHSPLPYDYDVHEEPAESVRSPPLINPNQHRVGHKSKPDSRYYSEADYEDAYNDPHQQQQQVVDAFYSGSDPPPYHHPHQDWPLETRDSYLYSGSEKHHKHYEVKEISYVYPILLALLILGALFVPFISLFLFLAVSAFNCHQLGSAGFANVTPILGRKRRRRRRSVNAVSSSKQLPVANNNNENDLRFVFGQGLLSDAFDSFERTDLITALQLPFALLSDTIGFASDSDPHYKYDYGLVPITSKRNETDTNGSIARGALLDSLTFANGTNYDYLKELMQEDSLIEPTASTELVYWRNRLAQTTALLRNALVEFSEYI